MVIHFPDKATCVKCEDPITGEMGYVKLIDGAVCWFCRPKKKAAFAEATITNNLSNLILPQVTK